MQRGAEASLEAAVSARLRDYCHVVCTAASRPAQELLPVRCVGLSASKGPSL